jgi:hypothetical protein
MGSSMTNLPTVFLKARFDRLSVEEGLWPTPRFLDRGGADDVTLE